MYVIVALLLAGLAQDPLLSTIQAEIAAADGAGQFYDRSYRPIEFTFWSKKATLDAAGFVIEKLSYFPEEGIARHFNLVLRRLP